MSALGTEVPSSPQRPTPAGTCAKRRCGGQSRQPPSQTTFSKSPPSPQPFLCCCPSRPHAQLCTTTHTTTRSSPLGQQHRPPLSSVDRAGAFAFRDDSTPMGPNPHRVTNSGAADSSRAMSATRSSRPAAGGGNLPSSPSPSTDLSTLAFASLLTDIRTRRLGPAATTANPLTVERYDGGEARTPTVPASPTGSASKHQYTPSQSPQPYQQGRQQAVGLRKQYHPAPVSAQGVTLGARKPHYDSITVHDLFIMSWMREPLTPRMLEYHTAVVQVGVGSRSEGVAWAA